MKTITKQSTLADVLEAGRSTGGYAYVEVLNRVGYAATPAFMRAIVNTTEAALREATRRLDNVRKLAAGGKITEADVLDVLEGREVVDLMETLKDHLTAAHASSGEVEDYAGGRDGGDPASPYDPPSSDDDDEHPGDFRGGERD